MGSGPDADGLVCYSSVGPAVRTAEPIPPQVWHPRDSVEPGTEIVSPPREAGTAGELLFLMASLGLRTLSHTGRPRAWQ